jgi:hypothetical protein
MDKVPALLESRHKQQPQGCLSHTAFLRASAYEVAENHALQFADVSGPRIGLKQLERLLMLLRNTQECDLSLNWKLSDFVKEDRASIC